MDWLNHAVGIRGGSGPTRASYVIRQSVDRVIPKKHILRESLRHIYERTYWQRMWVLQEFGLANDVVVCCGKKMVPWNSFLLLEEGFEYPEDDRLNGRDRAPNPAITLLQYRKNRVGMAPHQFVERYNLIALMFLFSDRLCSDPKDKIYALLSMAADCQNDEIKVDYSKTLFSIYCDALERCLGKSAFRWLTPTSLPWANQENQPVAVLQVIIRYVLQYALDEFDGLGWPKENRLVLQTSAKHRSVFETDLFGFASAGHFSLSTYQLAWTALLQAGSRAVDWLLSNDGDMGMFDEALQSWPLYFPIEVRGLCRLYLFLSVYSVYDKIDLTMTEVEVIIRPKGEGLSIIFQREREIFFVRRDK